MMTNDEYRALITKAREVSFLCTKCGHSFTRAANTDTAHMAMHDDANGCKYLAHKLPPNETMIALADALELMVNTQEARTR